MNVESNRNVNVNEHNVSCQPCQAVQQPAGLLNMASSKGFVNAAESFLTAVGDRDTVFSGNLHYES